MARNHAEADRYYRAVVTRTFDHGKVVQYVYGPYTSLAPAKGRITAHESLAKQSRSPYRNPEHAFSAVGHIESAEVIWMRESAGE
ncbi:hypothetical protein ABZ192_12635 [Streptomyces sp. NPDC006235]|uniref:hypothetical protein n=1 Tax=Streptomyces sp. NPDC006235 TaxID=3156736 RepID=UPI0033B6D53B